MLSYLNQFVEPTAGWLAAFFVLAAWWVKGMADRKRASTEAVVAERGVSAEVVEMLRVEVKRLTERVGVLEKDHHAKNVTISELTAEKITLVAELAATGLLRTAAVAEAAMLRVQLSTSVLPVVAASETDTITVGRTNKKTVTRSADAL